MSTKKPAPLKGTGSQNLGKGLGNLLPPQAPSATESGAPSHKAPRKVGTKNSTVSKKPRKPNKAAVASSGVRAGITYKIVYNNFKFWAQSLYRLTQLRQELGFKNGSTQRFSQWRVLNVLLEDALNRYTIEQIEKMVIDHPALQKAEE